MIASQEFRLKFNGVHIGEEIMSKNSLACHAAWTMLLVLFSDAVCALFIE